MLELQVHATILPSGLVFPVPDTATETQMLEGKQNTCLILELV